MARDYKAEERRRNERARALGFTSRAQQRRAIKQGAFPSARDIVRSPEAQRLVNERRKAQRERQARLEAEGPLGVGGRAHLTASDRDILSRAWSVKHSRQPMSEWNEGWSRARKDQYFYAFVNEFTSPHDERDFRPLNNYILAYVPYDPDMDDRSPYSND